MNTALVKIKLLSDKAIMPKRATDGSVAYDVYVPEDVIIRRGRQVVPLQFAIELPNKYYEAKIEPRSGFSSKGMEGYEIIAGIPTFGIVSFAAEGGASRYISLETMRFDADVITGKVDSDFRQSVGVIINNRDRRDFMIKAGTRIAQMTIYKTAEAELTEAEKLSETDRNGGFGHTGTN